jgi:hypothetical protein
MSVQQQAAAVRPAVAAALQPTCPTSIQSVFIIVKDLGNSPNAVQALLQLLAGSYQPQAAALTLLRRMVVSPGFMAAVLVMSSG